VIGYAALRWNIGSAAADAAVTAIIAALPANGLCKVIDTPGWIVIADRGAGAQVRSLTDPNHVVIGSVFDRRATDQSRHDAAHIDSAGGDFASLCHFLIQSCWGSYIAFGIDPAAPDNLALYREPIGMHEALTWVAAGGLRIVTSRPETLLPIAPPPAFGINWDRAAQLLQFAGSAGESVPLTGVHTVPTGAIVTYVGAASQIQTLWSPARFAAQRGIWPRPPEECLPDLVDACIGAWASTNPVAIAELSGGLDSAIVASGLARVADQPVRRWFHYYGPDAPGDERLFARAVAGRLILPLEERRVTNGAIDERLVESIPLGARPSVASLSLLHHADMAARGKALGATCLFTGQGGDALFFHLPAR
jgi:asparagine synthase (glutamine-hydrolysing)